MHDALVGVILAAGKGVRLYPYSRHTPKVLLEIDGKPLLLRNVEIMRDQLGINKIFVIVDSSSDIEAALGDGDKFGVSLQYIHNNDVKGGFTKALLLVRDLIRSHFCVILGDEFYLGSNHHQLLDFLKTDFSAVCALQSTADRYSIKKNYSVEVRDGLITSLAEKPVVVENQFLGCGTFLFSPDIFDLIKETPVFGRTGNIEMADVLNLCIGKGGKVDPFYLSGDYVNVNSIDDYNYANYLFRSNNFGRYKVSLIIPAYNEEDSIGLVVDDFKDRVDQVLVIDNSSSDKTAVVAKKSGAQVISGKFGGYGHALREGLSAASGDILVLTEADGTFKSRDLGKLLEYLKDCDMAIGTRTTKQMIEQAANMSFILRCGNIAVAKLIESLWWSKNEPRLTDVGCTYRAIWKSSYKHIEKRLYTNGPEFSPEMMVEVLNSNMRIIEIPVNYHRRISGTSKYSVNILANIITGLKMIFLILHKRLRF